MKRRNRVQKGNSKNGAKSQLRNAPGALAITKADFLPFLQLRNAQGQRHLANQLNVTAGQAAAMLKSLLTELWHIYETLPFYTSEYQRIQEMEGEVNKLAEDLVYQAGNKVDDAVADIFDAGGRTAFPAPPKGLTVAEFLALEGIDAWLPQPASIDYIRSCLHARMTKDLNEGDFIELMERLERRGLVEFQLDANEKPLGWILAGPLKGGLQ